ncbi:MBL fold metallo-hydrolase [Clostridiaceae bacterium 35-E11]
MKVTVLGNCGPYPRAGGACSGYLFESEQAKILIDCGSGTFSRLQQIIKDVAALDSIILTHFHSDHISDALVLKYGIGFGRINGKIPHSIPLYTPATPKDYLDKLQFQDAFTMNKITDNLKVGYKDIEIVFKKMNHSIECYGVMIKNKEKKFVYSADTKYCNPILELSQKADLLLCESSVLEKDKTPTTSHLSPKEAGEIAQKSNVKKLILTHFWPEYDLQEIMKEAKSTFDGELELAEEMKSYFL